MADTLGTEQPFRYRGYVYDEETRLYYLRDRYYINDLCRFVNSDIIINYNGFYYSLNNPICLYDKSGRDPAWIQSQVFERGYLLPANATQIHSDDGGTTYTPDYRVYFDDYYEAEAAKRMNVYSDRDTNSDVLVSDIKQCSFMFAKTIEDEYEWLEVIFVYDDSLLCTVGYAKAEDVYVKGSAATAARIDHKNDDPINVRSKPCRSDIIYKIEQTSCVFVIGYKNGYSWISTDQGCGWIKDEFIYFA